MRGAPSEQESGRSPSIWRNRTLLIIFLDLVLVLIIFGVANLVLPIFGSRTTIDGNLFRLRGVEVEGAVLATLVVQRESDEPPEGPAIFSVRFALQEGREELVELSPWISDVVPTVPEERRVVRHEIVLPSYTPQENPFDTVVAQLRYGDRELRIARRIITEP